LEIAKGDADYFDSHAHGKDVDADVDAGVVADVLEADDIFNATADHNVAAQLIAAPGHWCSRA
jgi:hypothetical protein